MKLIANRKINRNLEMDIKKKKECAQDNFYIKLLTKEKF